MLISLLLICYTLFTAYVSGVIFVSIFSKILGINNTQEDFTFISISGLCWIAIVVSIQHIFSKVGLVSHILIWVINSLAWTKYSKNFTPIIQKQLQAFRNKPTIVYFIYVLFLIGAILNILARPAVGDAADYHFQAIRWVEEYKVVAGIGNVRRQLGNNSNWFLLNAFFGLSFTGLRSVYVLNASLLLIACVYFSNSFSKGIQGKIDKLLIVKSAILIYLIFTVFRKYVGAVTNDYVITIMVLYIFTLLLETDKNDLFSRIMLIFFISVMITFKLSALPMFLLAVFLLYSIKGILKIRQLFILTLAVLFLYTPWIYTNIMHCGYLVFPITTPDLFNVDWKMRKTILEWEVMANLAWARVPFTDIDISSKYTFKEWFPLWIRSLDVFSIFLLSTSAMSSLFFTGLLTIKKVRNKLSQYAGVEAGYILITILVALYLWFTHGPTPRFVFGYLTFLLALYLWALSIIYPSIQELAHKNTQYIFVIITVIFFVSCTSFLPKYFTINSFANEVVVPKKYTNVITSKIQLNRGEVYVPNANEQCWDSPIPCTSALDSTLTWRGENMDEGFRIKQ